MTGRPTLRISTLSYIALQWQNLTKGNGTQIDIPAQPKQIPLNYTKVLVVFMHAVSFSLSFQEIQIRSLPEMCEVVLGVVGERHQGSTSSLYSVQGQKGVSRSARKLQRDNSQAAGGGLNFLEATEHYATFFIIINTASLKNDLRGNTGTFLTYQNCPKNVIFTFFTKCWCHPNNNSEMQKWYC